MRNYILQLHIYIITISIILCAFISSFGFAPSFLGGLGSELSFYTLFLGVMIYILEMIFYKRKCQLPNDLSFKFLILFFLVAGISGLLNIDAMYLNFRGVNGLDRYIVQICSLFVYIIISIYVYNILCTLKKNKVLELVKKAIFYSLLLSGIYSFFELLSFLGIENMRSIVNLIDSFFRNTSAVGTDLFAYPRIRSLTSEASYFAVFFSITFPWLLFRCIYTKKYTELVYCLYFIILLVLTLSRTAYVIGIFEVILVLFFARGLVYDYIKKKYKSIILGCVLIIVYVVNSEIDILESIDVFNTILSLFENDGIHDTSNITRYGSQYAAIMMLLDYPMFGVGFGEFPMHAVEYYPSWAWSSDEIIKWSINYYGAVLPPAHGLYARLLGETGLVGFLVWVIMLGCFIRELARSNKFYFENKYWHVALIISFLELCLLGFNIDALRNFYYWVFFAIVWSTNSIKR